MWQLPDIRDSAQNTEADIDAGWDAVATPLPEAARYSAAEALLEDEFENDVDAGWDDVPDSEIPPMSTARRQRKPKRGPKSAEKRAVREAKKAEARAAKRALAQSQQTNRAAQKSLQKRAERATSRTRPERVAPQRPVTEGRIGAAHETRTAAMVGNRTTLPVTDEPRALSAPQGAAAPSSRRAPLKSANKPVALTQTKRSLNSPTFFVVAVMVVATILFFLLRR